MRVRSFDEVFEMFGRELFARHFPDQGRKPASRGCKVLRLTAPFGDAMRRPLPSECPSHPPARFDDLPQIRLSRNGWWVSHGDRRAGVHPVPASSGGCAHCHITPAAPLDAGSSALVLGAALVMAAVLRRR
jgi:hypothetical protein